MLVLSYSGYFVFPTFAGSSLSVHLADNPNLAGSEHRFNKIRLLDHSVISGNLAITSVVPADFDGDAQMDIMVTLEARNQTDGPVKVHIYWGRQTSLDLSEFWFFVIRRKMIALTRTNSVKQ